MPDECVERGAALDRRHREIELEPFGLPGQREPDRMKQRLALLPRLLPHTRRPRRGTRRDRRSGPTVASSSASASITAARADGFGADLRHLASAARRASSRTGTAAAPAPARVDRPTRARQRHDRTREESEAQLDPGRLVDDPSRLLRDTAATARASRSGDRRPSDSAGSPRPASPGRTRRRCARRPRVGTACASSSSGSSSSSLAGRPADQREVVDERLRQVARARETPPPTSRRDASTAARDPGPSTSDTCAKRGGVQPNASYSSSCRGVLEM